MTAQIPAWSPETGILKRVPVTTSNRTHGFQCNHDKVYATLRFGDTLQRAWICNLCGSEGIEGIPNDDPILYHNTKMRFGK